MFSFFSKVWNLFFWSNSNIKTSPSQNYTPVNSTALKQQNDKSLDDLYAEQARLNHLTDDLYAEQARFNHITTVKYNQIIRKQNNATTKLVATKEKDKKLEILKKGMSSKEFESKFSQLKKEAPDGIRDYVLRVVAMRKVNIYDEDGVIPLYAVLTSPKEVAYLLKNGADANKKYAELGDERHKVADIAKFYYTSDSSGDRHVDPKTTPANSQRQKDIEDSYNLLTGVVNCTEYLNNE
ncbi:MAG: hypothetical protein DGJ47_000039 [Rickettsiaceae bacterium]